MKEFLKDFTAENNKWHEAKELANRWNGFPCYEQSNFPKQLSFSHLLESESVQANS